MNFSLRKLWRGVAITAVVFTLATSELLFGVAVTQAADTPSPSTTLPTATRAASSREVGEDDPNYGREEWKKCVGGIMSSVQNAYFNVANGASVTPKTVEQVPQFLLNNGGSEWSRNALSSYAHRIVNKEGGKNCTPAEAAKAYKYHTRHKNLFGTPTVTGSYDGLYTNVFQHYMGLAGIAVTTVQGDGGAKPTNPSVQPGQVPGPNQVATPGDTGPCTGGSCARVTGVPVDTDGDGNTDQTAARVNVPEGHSPSEGDVGDLPPVSTGTPNNTGQGSTPSPAKTQEDFVDESCGTANMILSWIFSYYTIKYVSCQMMYASKQALIDVYYWFIPRGTSGNASTINGKELQEGTNIGD